MWLLQAGGAGMLRWETDQTAHLMRAQWRQSTRLLHAWWTDMLADMDDVETRDTGLN